MIVEAVGLTKHFRDFWLRTKARAVDRVDFRIHAGEIFGLLGPNGSGKSTIIKILLGLLHPTRGSVSVFGKAPSDVEAKRRIGFLPEESYLYQFLTARETLDYYGRLFGLDRGTRRRRIDELLDMIGLAQVAHRPVGEFSKGMMRRIGIAQALINDPEFLILDEPTSGLDPIGTRQVKDLLIAMRARGKTILLSSHLLADVEDVCDRMVMLYGGRIRAEGTVDELLQDTDRTVIRTARLEPATITRIEAVLQACEGLGIEQVETPRQRLEQLFLDIVEQAHLEHALTSGVSEAGPTASFLAGEGAPSGGALIEALVHEEERDEPVAEETGEDATPPDTPGRDLLESLVEIEPPPTAAADSEASLPDAPGDVDESVIDSLLDDDDRDRMTT